VASFVLDDDLFDRTRDDYGDIRVVNAAGEEVPYLPRRRVRFETDVAEVPVRMKVVSLKELEDKAIEVVVERDDAKPRDICAFVLQTALKDFEKSVGVDGSNDKTSWEPVAAKAMIYDYTRYVSLRHTRIEVDAAPFKFYRLRIGSATEDMQSPLRRIMRDRRGGEMFSEQEHLTMRRRDFRIDRITGLYRKESVRRERGVTKTYKIDEPTVATDEETGDTLITFEMPRVPVRKVTLETPSANFVRPVVLEAAAGGEEPEWLRVASATLVSVEVGSVRRRNLDVVLQRLGRYGQYRLRIKNGDSPALDVKSLTVTGESWEVLFFHESGKTYSVFYGDKDVPRPSYDIGNVLSRVLVTDVDYYELGTAADNPELGKGPAKPLLSGKTLMIVVIVAVVGVLILLIAKASSAVEGKV